jgi:hypothetical protein
MGRWNASREPNLVAPGHRPEGAARGVATGLSQKVEPDRWPDAHAQDHLCKCR